MSALVLHGVLDRDARPAADAPPHQQIDVGALLALVSTTGDPPATDACDAAVEAALAHHHLLTSYCQAADLLPIRFGTAFSSQEALGRQVAGMAAQIQAALARISGCTEYILTVTAGAVAVEAYTEPDGGRAFLATKRRRRNDHLSLRGRRRSFIADLGEEVAMRVRAVAELDTNTAAKPLFRNALLVQRDAAGVLVELLRSREAQASALGLDLRLAGPGPCYSFADQTAAQGAMMPS